MKTLAEEKRPISAIFWDDNDGTGFTVGNTCDEILAFEETDSTPWLVIIKDRKVIARVPAYKVSVFY